MAKPTTQPNVVIYTKGYCPFCKRAKLLLNSKGVNFKEHDITGDNAKTIEMMQRSGRRTVPQIFINDVHIGGSDDLDNAASNGVLDRLLNSENNAA